MKITRCHHPLIIAAFLLGNSLLIQAHIFAQSSDCKKVIDCIEIVQQPDSPLVITPASIDNAGEKTIKIKFILQNIGSKKIENYALLLKVSNSDNSGVISPALSIDAGQSIENIISEAKANLKSDSKILASVDYIMFADGSSWGKDSKHESDTIKGSYAGRTKAILEIENLLNNPDRTELSKLLQSEIFEINPTIIDNDRSENWQLAFSVSYKSVLVDLQMIYKKYGIEALSSKLNKFRGLLICK